MEASGVPQKKVDVLARIRKFGGYMSGMVMPNLGAFVGWGLMAALFIPNGWFPNADLNHLIKPTLDYVFPMLIGYTAGYNIHGQRGGVIGLFATLGVIVGADITMISGAMIMGPLAAWLLKKFDNWVDGKVRPGFEMFVDNFSLGIIGAVLTILAYISIGPAIQFLVAVLSSGVTWATTHKFIPLLSVFMAPAQVLFLNNVVNHGILAPIGYAQAAEAGKSIMFLVDTNNGPLLGTLFAIALAGRGKAKNTAPMAMFIAGIAGIGEVYFPFVLANPILVFATMGGLAVSLFLQVLMGGGLIGVASPGSLINIAIMTPKDAIVANFVSILAGFIVSTLIALFLLKTFAGGKDDDLEEFNVGGRQVKSVANFVPAVGETIAKTTSKIKKIIVACDSGMGSSAMGASVLKNILKKSGYADISVEHSSANQIAPDADLVITLDSLIERAKLAGGSDSISYLPVNNFLKEDDYKPAIDFIASRNQATATKTEVDDPDDLVPTKNEAKVLPKENIKLHQHFRTSEEAIEAAGQVLASNGFVDTTYIDDMLKRNEDLSVYVGNHVAVPHGLETSDPKIKKSGLSVLQVPEGVEFGPDEIAYVIIGIAGKSDTHLEMLTKISLVLMDEANVEKIRSAESEEEIMAVLNIS